MVETHELGATIVGGVTIWIIIFVTAVSIYFCVNDRKNGKGMHTGSFIQ
jgi:hypothetical protein